MNKHLQLLISLIFISLVSISLAQDKMLTLEDAVYMNPDVLPKKMNQLQWMGKSNRYSYVEKDMLIAGNVLTEGKDTLVTLDDINAGLEDMNMDSIKKFPNITFIDDFNFRFIFDDKLLLCDVISKNLQFLNYYYENGKNIDIFDETSSIAYTIDNNLYVAHNTEQIQVTNDDNPGIVNGQSVHRNEFGIYKGTFWSPKGNYLAFYRKDETMVTDYPLGKY